MVLLKTALETDIGYNTDTGVLPVKGHPSDPQPGDITLRHKDSILLKTDRRSTVGDADEEIFSQGGSIETPNALFIRKTPTGDVTVIDEGDARNLVRSATFSDGTVVGDIGGDVFVTTEDDVTRAKKDSSPYWITRQGTYTTDSTGTSFTVDYTTSSLNRRSTDGKIKSDLIPAGTKVQMKLSLQSAPSEYLWQNVSDEEFQNDLGADVNVSTGEFSLLPNIYIPGSTAVRITLNFSESLSLKGGNDLGTDIYIEAYGEDIAFDSLVNQTDAEIKTQYENNANTNAFDNDEKWKARISARITSTHSITATESVIPFSIVDSSRDMTVSSGVFTIQTEGHYSGHMDIYALYTGLATFGVWIEHKPLGGSWSIVPNSLRKFSELQATAYGIGVNGGLDLGAGDEVKIMTKAFSNSLSLVTQTETIYTSESISQPAASISFTRVDNVIA